jgi:ssDNA-binding Zn-finger/Zn-ribbon topoisomerase 1
VEFLDRRRFKKLAKNQAQRVEPVIAEVERDLEQISERFFSAVEGVPGARPRCPGCGSRMYIRVAKTGRYEGQEYWGCHNYPSCQSFRTRAGAARVYWRS